MYKAQAEGACTGAAEGACTGAAEGACTGAAEGACTGAAEGACTGAHLEGIRLVDEAAGGEAIRIHTVSGGPSACVVLLRRGHKREELTPKRT
jgi:hypothetical protein